MRKDWSHVTGIADVVNGAGFTAVNLTMWASVLFLFFSIFLVSFLGVFKAPHYDELWDRKAIVIFFPCINSIALYLSLICDFIPQ